MWVGLGDSEAVPGCFTIAAVPGGAGHECVSPALPEAYSINTLVMVRCWTQGIRSALCCNED